MGWSGGVGPSFILFLHPALQLIQAGKGEAIRIRSILRSLVPTEDLVGIISIPLKLPSLNKGKRSSGSLSYGAPGGHSLRVRTLSNNACSVQASPAGQAARGKPCSFPGDEEFSPPSSSQLLPLLFPSVTDSCPLRPIDMDSPDLTVLQTI